MPGMPSTTPQTKDNHDPNLLDLLQHVIHGYLTQPEPKPPMPPGQQPVSQLGALAAARNPQFAPAIMQQAQQPAQAQYAQAQQIFEQAMQDKDRALTAGVALAGNQARLNRPDVQEFQREVNGEPHRIRQVLVGGQVAYEQDLGKQFVPPSISPYINPQTGAADLGRVSRTTGQIAPVTSGGQQVGAVPPGAIISETGRGQATLAGMDEVTRAYHDIRQQTQQQTPFGQWARERAVQNVPGPTSAYFPEYASYVATRQASLNAYIKSVTGAQFSVQELRRYERQFPEPWDPEDVAANKIAQLKERAVNDMQSKLRTYPSLGGPTAKPTPTPETPEQKKARIKAKWGIP